MAGSSTLRHIDTGAQPWRDLGLWSLAALMVCGLHGGAVALYLREPPVPVSDGGPPPAIMIELAPMPEATDTDQTELSSDQQDSHESAAVEEVKAPEPEPEPVEETPVEALPEPEEITEPEDLLPEEVPQEAEVALPMERSPRPEPRPETPPEEPKPVKEKPRDKPKPAPKAASAAAEARTKARNAEAEAATRDAASQSAADAGRAMSPAKWQSRLMAHLERHKPKSRGTSGTAYVRFTIDAGGRVLSASLARSSGNAGIDEAAVNTVRSASPVPAPPPGVNLSMTVAVEFKR